MLHKPLVMRVTTISDPSQFENVILKRYANDNFGVCLPNEMLVTRSPKTKLRDLFLKHHWRSADSSNKEWISYCKNH